MASMAKLLDEFASKARLSDHEYSLLADIPLTAPQLGAIEKLIRDACQTTWGEGWDDGYNDYLAENPGA